MKTAGILPAVRERSFTVRWRAWAASKGPVMSYGVRLGLLMALFYGFALLPFFDQLLTIYLEANAWFSGIILNSFGQECHVSGITIRSARFAISVRRGCDALEPSWFFCAAVLSFPAPAMKKLLGMLLGTGALHVLNVVRILSLYFLGVEFPQYFQIAHAEIWPGVFIVMTILLWLRWIGWVRKDDELKT